MIEVRDAVEADSRVIAALVTAAFGQPQESRLVEQLTRDGDCATSAFQSLELSSGSLTGVLAHAHYAPAFTVLDADT
jgi:predicted N-acetyltransferase YhbS